MLQAACIQSLARLLVANANHCRKLPVVPSRLEPIRGIPDVKSIRAHYDAQRPAEVAGHLHSKAIQMHLRSSDMHLIINNCGDREVSRSFFASDNCVLQYMPAQGNRILTCKCCTAGGKPWVKWQAV